MLSKDCVSSCFLFILIHVTKLNIKVSWMTLISEFHISPFFDLWFLPFFCSFFSYFTVSLIAFSEEDHWKDCSQLYHPNIIWHNPEVSIVLLQI